MLRELASLPDEKLWSEITKKAAKFGYTLPNEVPSKENMAKIRDFMNNAEKINTAEVLRLMATIKSNRKRG